MPLLAFSMAGTDGMISRSLPRKPNMFNQLEIQLDSHTST